MIEEPTVLVLGAGASKPYGFPTGRELVRRILRALDNVRDDPGGDPGDLGALIGRAGFNLGVALEFRDLLRRSRWSSIDRFLEYQEAFQQLGKFLIAAFLLPLHRESSRLYPDQGDWISYLLDFVPMDEPNPGLLSVVTFNYDTVFEHVVRTALESRYPRGDQRRKEAFDAIKVVHLHGTLCGALWRGAKRANEEHADPDQWQRVRSAASGVQIVSEVDEEGELPSEFQDAQRLIAEALRVCFLGFGYLPDNLRRLGFSPRGQLDSYTTYYCCTKGMGSGEIRRAKHNLGQLHGRSERIVTGQPGYDAREFLREYPVLGP